METVNLIFDFVLLFAAIWMIVTVKKSGLAGVVGSTLSIITIGALILGFAHMLETVTFEVAPDLNVALGEFIHRVVVLAGFVFLIIGFRGLSKSRLGSDVGGASPAHQRT